MTVSASDEDGDDLTYSISGDDDDKFSQSEDTFTWTPPYDDYSSNNTFNITIVVSDGTDTVTEDIVITVNDDTTAPSAPTIEGITAGSYNTDQSFTITGEDGAVIEYSTDGGANWNEYSSEVTLSTEGSYEITAKQTDEAGNISNNTEAITVTIDKTAPAWETSPYISTSADIESVGISTVIDEDGTVYYKVMDNEAGEPTAAEVKEAVNDTAMTAEEEKEITIDSLDTGTEYDIFFAVEDSAGNLQSDSIVKKVDVNTQLSEPHNSSFVNVPAGTTSSDNGEISLDYHIEMSKYEVTHAEYIDFLNDAGVAADGSYKGQDLILMGKTDCAVEHDGNSFYFAGSGVAESDNTPMVEVTWLGALAYCNWLSEQEGLNPAYDLDTWKLKDGPKNLEGYRLPNMTEQEYAMRGGANGDNTTYAGSDNIDEVAWYFDNSGYKTHPVGEKEANELGIYDMSGNVFEWLNTAWRPRYWDMYICGGSFSTSTGGSYDYLRVDSIDGTHLNAYQSKNDLGFRPTKTK